MMYIQSPTSLKRFPRPKMPADTLLGLPFLGLLGLPGKAETLGSKCTGLRFKGLGVWGLVVCFPSYLARTSLHCRVTSQNSLVV